jgi:hypothetical protein
MKRHTLLFVATLFAGLAQLQHFNHGHGQNEL